MQNTTNKGAWAIKNTVLPLDNPTDNENAPEIAAIERAAERLGAEADAYDLDGDGQITGVSVTGPAEAIDALVALFTSDAARPATAPAITPLVIPTIDFFEAHNLINTLSENEGNDAAIIAIENWLGENASAAAEEYARRGYADLAADILEIYGGEGDDDWADVTSAIDAARSANEEADEGAYLAETIAAWRARPENAGLDALLVANAIDTNASPENLYRAGVFEGLAAALGTQLSWASDDVNEIQAAIYRTYGVAW